MCNGSGAQDDVDCHASKSHNYKCGLVNVKVNLSLALSLFVGEPEKSAIPGVRIIVIYATEKSGPTALQSLQHY
jgi:hypothetical protein